FQHAKTAGEALQWMRSGGFSGATNSEDIGITIFRRRWRISVLDVAAAGNAGGHLRSPHAWVFAQCHA
ncbi:hypothetical protein, partial [Xanthomonas oryzae]|uniref:hypothetical protein n=1 Tax=Xanthomonas oryzae TaxID=347 RepID=UPI001C52F3E0